MLMLMQTVVLIIKCCCDLTFHSLTAQTGKVGGHFGQRWKKLKKKETTKLFRKIDIQFILYTFVLLRTLPYVGTLTFKQNGIKSAKVQRVMLSPKKVAKHQATVYEVLDLFIAGQLVTFGTCLSVSQVAELLANKIEQNRCFSTLI